MRITRSIAMVAVIVTAGSALAACSSKAAPVNVTPPSNVAQLQKQPIGVALRAYGYQPVANLYDKNRVNGQLYMVCPANTAPAACGANVHNMGTAVHPNVYVFNGKVVTLEGPHDGNHDNRSYYVSVPARYQDFSRLTRQQQVAVLGIMPEVMKKFGARWDGTDQKVLLSLGESTVTLSHTFPM